MRDALLVLLGVLLTVIVRALALVAPLVWCDLVHRRDWREIGNLTYKCGRCGELHPRPEL